MKKTIFYILFTVLLVSSAISCSAENLPFLNGKYFYWLGVLCLIPFAVAFNNNRTTIKIDKLDAVLFVLIVFGISHFLLSSNATIYNIDICNYFGYSVLYLLLRYQLSTATIARKTLFILLYFCSSVALINVLLMILQWKQWLTAPNQFFLTTGMFYSPNQLGIFLSVGFLSTFFLWQKTAVSWQKIVLVLIGILIFSGLCYTESRGAFISLIISLGIFYALHKHAPNESEPTARTYTNWKIYAVIVVVLVASLYFLSKVNQSKTESTSGRWFTTKQVLKQIAEHPFGQGLNSFSVAYNNAKAVYFEKNTNWDEIKNAGYLYKANNDVLELTFELGVPWMLIFLFFILLLYWNKSSSVDTRIARTIFACLLLFSLTTSIIMTPVLVIIACVCAIIIGNTTKPKVVYEFNKLVIFRILVPGLTIFLAFIVTSRINAESKLFRLYEDKMYLKSESQVQGYISKIDEKGEEFFMGGLTLIKNGYVNEGFQYLQNGFERSGRPSLGRVLANGLQQQKKYEQAEAIFIYNKNVEPYRFEARMDLLNLFIETNQNAKAEAMAQEILQLPVKIHSSTIKSYKNKATTYLDSLKMKSKQND